MTEFRELPVPDNVAGERVDSALSTIFGVSRTKAAELCAAGRVHIDGVAVGKSERLIPGTLLEIELDLSSGNRSLEIVAEPIEGLNIIYDDDDVVVVDKPVGVAAHPSPGWTGPTVVGALAGVGYRIATSGPPERQGIVHRLDVGTSGLMAVAKSERAYSQLKRAFRERRVDKTYHAVVQGHPDPSIGTIDAPIGRHRGRDYKFAVVSDGKDSITHYEVVEAFPGASLVEVNLETGRTHQIRVHFSAMRHPCVGDITYGADPTLADQLRLKRQWLHAVRLRFEHPSSGDWLELASPYPDDLAIALAALRERL